MSNATSTPEAGQILAGKYLVEEVLGVGGMGVVVAARHVQLDQRVAIKYLLPAALLNPEVVERFAREARAAAKIRGEHVARVIDVGQFDDGAPFMVMEHLEGEDLAKLLEKKGKLDIEDAIRYLLETCEALAEAHSAKIVHRDLKPSNLFLSKQPDKSAIIKVLDFGISKTGDAPSASLTKTSALMGTAFYMSPEQLTNPKGVDHRSDIWSLGVILFELLAGRQPFLGESVPEIIGGILTNQPDSIRTLRAEVPVGLEAVIVKCMQTKPADRYQNVAAFAAAMGPYAHIRDRVSIDAIARVLGQSVAPEPMANLGKATVLMPPSAQQTGPAATAGLPGAPSSSAVAPAPTPSAPPPSMQAVDSHTAPAVAAVTTHGMSTSAITTKPKRTPVWLLAAAVAVVIGGGGVAMGIKLSGDKAAQPPPAAAALVAPPPANSALPAGNANPTTVIVPTTAAPATAAPADPTPATSAPAIPVVNGRPTAAPRVVVPPASAAAPVKSAIPVASAAPPPPPASATPPPATATAAATSKNPLNMGIK